LVNVGAAMGNVGSKLSARPTITDMANGSCLKQGRTALFSRMRHSKWRTSESPAANSGHVLAWTDDNYTFILSQC
jgi:hypothetical protein